MTRISNLVTSLEKVFELDREVKATLSAIAAGTGEITKEVVQGFIQCGVGIHELVAVSSCCFIAEQHLPFASARILLCETAISNSWRVRSNDLKCRRLIDVLRKHKRRCCSSQERSFIRIAMAACGEKRSIAKLFRQCDHPDALVQWYSIQCLRVVGTRNCNMTLKRALRECQGTVARCEIAAVLVRNRCKAGIHVLTSELASKGLSGYRLCFIAFVLAWAGIEEGINAVRQVCEGVSDARIAGRMLFFIETYAASSQESRYFLEEMRQLLVRRGVQAT